MCIKPQDMHNLLTSRKSSLIFASHPVIKNSNGVRPRFGKASQYARRRVWTIAAPVKPQPLKSKPCKSVLTICSHRRSRSIQPWISTADCEHPGFIPHTPGISPEWSTRLFQTEIPPAVSARNWGASAPDKTPGRSGCSENARGRVRWPSPH